MKFKSLFLAATVLAFGVAFTSTASAQMQQLEIEAEEQPAEFGLMGTAGVMGFIDDEMFESADAGFRWGVTFAGNLDGMFGYELEYIGSAQEFGFDGAIEDDTLISNGAGAKLRLNLMSNAGMPGQIVPFIAGGGAWRGYTFENDTSELEHTFELPVAAGASYIHGATNLLFDARAAVRPVVGFQNDFTEDLHNWEVTASLGGAF